MVMGLGLLSLQATTLTDVFPTPANSLGGTLTIEAGSKINGTTANTLVTPTLLDNGGLCDGGVCTNNVTTASTYSFTLDAGNGSDGTATVNTTYSTDKMFDNITLNPGDSITFENDITVKIQYAFSPSGTVNIDGNVVIHVPTFHQNSSSTINVISGSLTIIADYITLNDATTSSPSALLCLANNTLKVNSNVVIKALLYSSGSMILNDGCVITGAATADTLTLQTNATINYDLGTVVVPSVVTNIAEYHFDECSWNGMAGEVKDSSGNGFDGVAISGAVTDIGDGQVNGSGKFTGDDDAVKVEGITGLDSSDFTVSFWTKIDTNSSATHELLKLGNVNAGSEINGDKGVIELRYRESDDELRVSGNHTFNGNFNGYSQIVTADLNDGNWHHIVLTYHAESMKIYVDAVDMPIGFPDLQVLDDFNGVLRVGNSINGLFNTQTNIDEVKLYAGAMDQSMISTLYSNEAVHKNADGTTRAAVVCKGLSGSVFNSASGGNIANAAVYLYKDTNGDGKPDAGDTLVGNTNTDASGNYQFPGLSGVYFVAVDSHTLDANGAVWMEQSHGAKGAFCADGSGGTIIRSTEGVCYGGKDGALSDDISAIDTAEHIAMVDVNGTGINNVNFGFNANVVTNVNDSGQGSLRQFITNTNILTGANEMRFVPTVPKNSATWWTVTLASALPDITDSLTTIDGTAYMLDANQSLRDTNSGTVATVATVGVDALPFGGFEKKELEIDIDHVAFYGLHVKQNGISDITIKNIAIFGSKDNTAVNDESSDILVSDGASNIDISYNFVGLRADGSTPATKTEPHGITLIQNTNSISNFKIHHNYVGHIGGQGIYTTGHAINSGEIYQNEVFHAYWLGDWNSDGIATENGAENIHLYENYVHDNNGPGFESWEAKRNIRWTNNTSYHNGFDPDGNPNGITEMYGLRSMGDDNVVENNLIYDNAGAGVVVAMFEDSATNTQRTHITKNSLYANREISIDLDQTHGNGSNAIGDGITINNGTKDSSKQNEDMDFPIFSKVTFDGTILNMSGYVGSSASQSAFANSTIEVYKVDDDGDSNGEGRWYLGSCSTNLSDGNFTCAFTPAAGASLILGDSVTATATDAGNSTSEFGPNQLVESLNTFSCEQEAYIFSSLNVNQTTKAYLVDITGNSYTLADDNVHPSNINAIGYNISDNYIWGYDRANHDVVRVDNTYLVEAIPKVTNLPEIDFHIGDVSPDGILYMTERGSSTIYRVGVNPGTIATYGTKLADLNVTEPIEAADFAFSTKDNMLYYVSDDEHLMRVNPTDGTITNLGEMELPSVSEVHSAFFDKDGFMYAFHGRYNYIYKFTVPLSPVPTGTKIQTQTFAHIDLGSQGDGARCANAPMDTTPTLSITPTFDVIDAGWGYTPEANITTKKVGEPFNLTILSQDLNNSAALKDVNITQLDLYDCSNNLITPSWWSGPTQITNAEGYTEINALHVDTAQRCLKVKVYGTHDGNANSAQGVDDFAVRPVHFSITPLVGKTPAGEDFLLHIQAENFAGAATPSYNEVMGSSFRIDANETNVSCISGDLNVSGAFFTEGDLTYTSTYSNVGDINITVQEINGSEFASIDSDDTPDNQRFIAPDSITHTFIPYEFSLAWDLKNDNIADGFTYFSNDLTQVASELSLEASARNKSGDITDNYKNGCAANPIMLTISFDTEGIAGSPYTLKWRDETGEEGNKSIAAATATDLTISLDSSEFDTGELNKTIQFNFARAQNIPLEPLEFGVTDVDVNDVLNAVDDNLSKVDEHAMYYYGRLHAPDYSVVGKDFNASIYHEIYCKSCDTSVFTFGNNDESVDSVHWYIIPSNTQYFMNAQSLHDSIVSGSDVGVIALQAPKLPHKNGISFKPDAWLYYDKFNTLTQLESFKIAFAPTTAKWSGQGEVGMTADMNVSKQIQLQKIDW